MFRSEMESNMQPSKTDDPVSRENRISENKDLNKDISEYADVNNDEVNIEVCLNPKDFMKIPSQPLSLNNDATNSPNVPEPIAASETIKAVETPDAIPYEQNLIQNDVSENNDRNGDTSGCVDANEEMRVEVCSNEVNADFTNDTMNPVKAHEAVVAFGTPPAIKYDENLMQNDTFENSDRNEDASGYVDINVEVCLNPENSDFTNESPQPLSGNNHAENAPNVSEPAVTSETIRAAETPAVIPSEEDLRGMNPADVIRRRAMPASPEMQEYIQRLNEYNHEAVAMNLTYINHMRHQSELELNAFMAFMQNEEISRQNRLEAATMLFVFYIPPIWKRVVAELIDFFILLIIKLIVTFLILDTFSIITNISRMHITQWIESPQIAAKMSTEIALLEIPFRIIVIIYETFFTVKYAGTPGKRWMGLRVLHVRELGIMDGDVLRRPVVGAGAAAAAQRPPRTCVRINPATVLPFRFALMRSVLKNAFVGLLMSPVCFSFIFVNQNRTGYDVMTNSMVVEFKPNTNQDGPIWN